MSSIDGYHGFMAVPTDLSAVARRVFYIAGGYKYAMAGEGACFMHCPPGYAPRPRDTGWFAAFGALSARQSGVPYGDGRLPLPRAPPSIRPGLYRMRAVFDWMDEIGLTVAGDPRARARARSSISACASRRARSARCRPPGLSTPIEDPRRGHFLTFETPRAEAIYAIFWHGASSPTCAATASASASAAITRPADIDRAFDRLEHGALLSGVTSPR